ncbi:hypothetical protein [robinz microvirus RP_172]|nr:hypothetical protein [robinz microvirus RP_172]
MAAKSARIGEPLPGLDVKAVFEQSVQALYLNADGHEMPNPVPLAPPIGYVKQPTIAEQIRRAIAAASAEARNAGAETEEEANDFDVGEDYDPTSPHENDFEMDPALEAMLALQSAPPAPPPAAPAEPVNPTPIAKPAA